MNLKCNSGITQDNKDCEITEYKHEMASKQSRLSKAENVEK